MPHSLDMTPQESPKVTADHLAKSDWNTMATFGALDSPKLSSPLRSPTVCRADPFTCTLPHESPTVKADSDGGGSSIPSHITLDRKKQRVSDRSSCDDHQPGSNPATLHSSGFLTPPSRNSSPSHSDHVGARARLPPPMTPPGVRPAVAAEAVDNWHWLRYPKIRLSDYQLKSYLWLPVTKNDPRPGHVESRKGSSLAGSHPENRKKSVTFNFDDVKQSIDRMRSMPVTPSISRRWSSTGLDRDAITRGAGRDHHYGPERRRTIPSTDRGAEALTAIKKRLTRRDIYAHQMETPTIITLRRASAVLDTVAQRQMSMTGDPTPKLPAAWEQASSEVPLAAYLITADEIHTLASLIRRTFADGTPQASSMTLETVSEDDTKPRKNKSRSASLIRRGKAEPERKFPANVAISVADVHSLNRPSSFSRKGSFMSQMSRKTSIVSTMLARKSVHEIIWEDDGTPQSLRSSTWNLHHDPLKNDVATWSSNAFRRESGELGVSVTEKPDTQASSGATSPGKKSPRPPTFKPVFKDTPKFKKKFESKYSHPPHWKAGSMYELPFPGVLPQADDGPIPRDMPILIDDVVSFPPLPQRHSTSEWQVPPTDINTPLETPDQEVPNIFLRHPSNAHSVPVKYDSDSDGDDENKLYRYGIDATIKPSVSRISATAPTSPTPMIKTTLWGSDVPASSPDFSPLRRRSSLIPVPNMLKKQTSNTKLGSAIGASSGARRRSSTRAEHIRIVTAQLEKERGKEPWRKARKDSGYPGLAPPSSDEGSDMSGGSGEEGNAGNAANELNSLLAKGKGKEKARTGMVLQLPSSIRKKAATIRKLVGTRVTEENEDEVERERQQWRQEKARSPSPTRKIPEFKALRMPVENNLWCDRADCSKSSCGNNHDRPTSPVETPQRPQRWSEDGLVLDEEDEDGDVYAEDEDGDVYAGDEEGQ